MQVRKAAVEAQKQFPGHRVVFVFDNSAIHRARAADALHAGSLNAYKEGGAVPKMRPGWFRDRQGNRIEQSLLDKHGEMRPMKSLLEERGLYQPDMDKAAMAAVLAAQPDFIEQRTLVEELLEDLEHGCLFLPKCHCELNPIELVWSAAKRYCRKHCKYSLKALRATIPEALASVSLDSIRAFFERANAWADAYRSGKDFVEARAAVKEQAKARRNARAKAKAAAVEAQSAASNEESESDARAEDSSSAEDSESELESDAASGSEPEDDDRSDRGSDEENEPSEDDDIAMEPEQSDADGAGRRKQPRRAQAAPQAQPEIKPCAAGRGVVGPSQVILRRSCCSCSDHILPGAMLQVPCGFKNQNNQCYVIAAVQLLFGVPVFLRSLLQLAANPAALAQASAVVRTLAQLAAAANLRRNQHVALQAFARAACSDTPTRLSREFANGRENDASEFLSLLLAHLRETRHFEPNVFDVEMHFRRGSAIHCPACGQRTDNWRGDEEGARHALQLSSSQLTSPDFDAALANLTAMTKGRDKCIHCAFTGLKDRHSVFDSPPKVLFVQIQRISAGQKCNNPLAVPLSATFAIFRCRYRLIGAAVHHGQSVDTGHWTSLVIRSGSWFSTSDTAVQPADVVATLASADFQSNVAALLFERDQNAT